MRELFKWPLVQVANLQFGSASQFRQYIFMLVFKTTTKSSHSCGAVSAMEL